MRDPKPVDRMNAGDPDPGLLAELDQARAESQNDLGALLASFAAAKTELGEPRAVSVLTQSLLDSAAWRRLELATVLVEALARLAPDEMITIEREKLQALFDLAVHSMDFGSGFWSTEDTVWAREVAVLLGVEPMEATPASQAKSFAHVFAADFTGYRCKHCSLPAAESPHVAATLAERNTP